MLKRYPHRQNDPLQAWDAADDLMLEHLKTEKLTGKRILILNDHFGALSCGLKDQNITSYTDSFVSAQAIRLNSKNQINPIQDLEALDGAYDLVLMRIPKNLSFFEDELCHLSAHLHRNSKVICASMLKHLPESSFELLQKYVGETTTSLAKKKARLIFATFQKAPVASPFPIQVTIGGFDQPFTHHSNLFSREKLDIGTRFLLEHIPRGDYQTILDLGCANGVVGIHAKRFNPQAQIYFSDESAMAIQSARLNYKSFYSDDAHFILTNCFENQEKDFLDLVICNPPFHQENTVGDFIAEQMFKDAHRSLKKGGLIRVIGNSHLAYQITLKKIFGNSQIIDSNPKFNIIDAIK